MKKISSVIVIASLLFFSACNNSGKEKEESKKDSTPTVKAPEKPAPAPDVIVLVQHQVKSFDKWIPVFKADDSARKANGLTTVLVGKGLDNPNAVIVGMLASDVQKAKQFAAAPQLKDVMQKAGVVGAPTISYVTILRNDTTDIPQKDRVLVSHHVKDFDAWLKVYDGEGKDTRAANGLIDRGLGRGVDDPNTVYILFAISDMKKAKARSNSPEMKKLMTDAGVDSKPVMTFYKVVE